MGVDLSSDYIKDARMRFPGYRFETWDITKPGPDLGKFDVALINSVFHHLSNDESEHLLRSIPNLLFESSIVWIIDLVMPSSLSPARLLAKLDRGRYPRSIEEWDGMFRRFLEVEVLEAFPVGPWRSRLWEMVFVQGRPMPRM